jgi:glycosyltransferase involved in cell wall biosynthesis
LKVLVTHELHAVEHQGRYYNRDCVIDYGALCNYLHTIPRGVFVVRCSRVEAADGSWPRIDGEGVEVQPIPEFGRLGELLKNAPRIVRNVWRAVSRADRYVVRMPGPTGALVAMVLMLRGKRYGIELAGRYEESLQDVIKLRRLGPAWIAKPIDWLVTFVVRRAVVVAYRSQYLRRLYPARRWDRQFIFSGAQLKPEVITGPRAAAEFRSEPFRIVSIGRVAVGKGYPLLVRVFAELRQRVSTPLELEIIGSGDELKVVRQEVQRAGLTGVVSLPGRIPWGTQLFARLNGAHLFVLPSECDGLPRSLVEAMARGMPCLSTAVGGIPELLETCDLVPPRDERALLEKIVPLTGDCDRLAEMSRRNFEKSKQHWPEALDRAKRGFWECVVKYAR